MDFLSDLYATLHAIDAFFFAHPQALGMMALSAFSMGMSLGYIRTTSRDDF